MTTPLRGDVERSAKPSRGLQGCAFAMDLSSRNAIACVAASLKAQAEETGFAGDEGGTEHG